MYRWINLKNGKSYIGSSVNLSSRFQNYYSIYYLEEEIKRSQSIIARSLLKYGYSNFSLEIIEYCEKSKTIPREQYFLDKFQPEYNI